MRALSIKVQDGVIGGNLPLPGRHLPIHGGHQQDGKGSECYSFSFSFFFSKEMSLTSNQRFPM